MIRLKRSDPARNMHRFYAVQLAPTLFGEWALVAEWGRIGSHGKVRKQVFPTEQLAQAALANGIQAKTRRGYQPLTCFIFRFVRRPR